MHDEQASSPVPDRVPLSNAGTSLPMAPHAPLDRAATYDDFEIIREIGRGGTAIVYEARQKSLHRNVALKRLPAAAALDQRWLERFRNEIRAVAQLNHPNIVAFFDTGQDKDAHFYAMQLVDGISLAEVIERLRQCRESTNETARPCGLIAAESVHPAFLKFCQRCQCRLANPASAVSPDAVGTCAQTGNRWKMVTSGNYHEAVATMIRDAAQALDYAHAHAVLHLDIKPSNLLIDAEGKLWVTDFGASRSGSGSSSSGGGGRVGTLRYMSPEQLLGNDDQLDRRSDVYSLGVTLYELLTLERPFVGETRGAFATHMARYRFRSLRDIHPGVPRELSDVAQKAMAQTPGQRYATAAEMAQDLQRFLDNQRVSTRSASLLSRAGNWSSRRRWLVWTSASILLIALLALVAGNRVLNRSEPVAWTEESRTAGLWQQRAAIAESALQQGAYRASADHYQAALDLVRSEQGPAAPQTLAVKIKLGEALKELGEWENAAKLLRDCLETSRRTLGIEHTTVRDALFQLHKLSQLQDKDDAAKSALLDLLRQHVTSRQRSSGTDDVDTLKAVENLVELLCDSGAFDEAPPLVQQLVAGRRRTLGPEHRETLEAEGSSAMLLMVQGKAGEAEAAMRVNMEARRKLLGPQHASTLEAANNLAVTLIRQDKLEEAELLLRQVGDGCRETLGADHPRTAFAHANLGVVLMSRNKLVEAEQLYRDMWETICRTRGNDHVEAVQAGYWLNRLLRQVGKYDEAEAVGRQNLAAADRSLPEEHTIRGEAVIQLGLTLRAQLDPNEAHQFEMADLGAIFKKKESVADSLSIAHASFDQLNLADAEEFARIALDTMRRSPVEHAPIALAETLALAGRILGATDGTEEATTLLRECLAIRTQTLAPNHWLVAETQSLLGDRLARRGLYAEAEPLLIDSYPCIATSGPSQPVRSIEALDRIVGLYDRWDKSPETLRWGQELEAKLRDELGHHTASLPPDHWRMLTTQSHLGHCLAAMGRTAEAQPLLYDSYAALSQLWIREGRDVVRDLRWQLRRALDRIVRFHQRRDESELATAWLAMRLLEVDKPSVEEALQVVTHWEQVCQKFPNEPHYVTNLATTQRCLAAATKQAVQSEKQPKEERAKQQEQVTQ